MSAASTQAGASRVTVWRWRRDDPEFDSAVSALTDGIDDQRVRMVEESMFARIVKGEATAAETIFYLVNRGRGRWRHVQKINVEHSGPDGGPIKTEQTIDLSSLSTETLRRIRADLDAE